VISDIGAFLAMGDYAEFVWPAYGIAFVVLGGLAVFSWRRYRESTVTLERLQQDLRKRR
jgi:heme exporter protein D